jgi:hypothetical protein
MFPFFRWWLLLELLVLDPRAFMVMGVLIDISLLLGLVWL